MGERCLRRFADSAPVLLAQSEAARSPVRSLARLAGQLPSTFEWNFEDSVSTHTMKTQEKKKKKQQQQQQKQKQGSKVDSPP